MSTITTTSGFERIRQTETTLSSSIDATGVVADTRRVFESGKTLPLSWRIGQLRQIEKLLVERCDDIVGALKKDLNRPPLESLLADVNLCLDEARLAISQLPNWAQPEHVPQPIALQPGSSKIVRQPKGVVLVIGAWNFPIQITILPLIAAISAGCCTIIKPSEIAVNSATLIEDMINQYLDTSCTRVVQGGVAETTALLDQPFDHIFYTGNASVAKAVMTAAAKHLTPLTLELGGKSPAIVDISADLKVSIRRILSGKFFNAGQVCIAPDYILCVGDNQRHMAVLRTIKATVHEMFGDNPQESDSFGRIVNERHWDRVTSLIKTAQGEIVCGGLDTADRTTKYVPPTVIWGVSPSSALMHEEIFGPVLPVITVATIQEAILFVNARPRPLALYVFSKSQQSTDNVIDHTWSGSACINDTMFQACNPFIPFGGIGTSGMGSYHGRFGFEEFSHRRAVMSRSTWLDLDFRYAPYQQKYVNLIKKFLVKAGLAVIGRRIAQTGSIIALAIAFAMLRKHLS